MRKPGNKNFTDVLEDEKFINRKLSMQNRDVIVNFDPKIHYVSIYYAQNRDVFLKTPHKHDFQEIAYVAQGGCEIVLDDYSFPLSQGEAVLYPYGVTHTETPIDNNIEMYFLGFSNIDSAYFLGEDYANRRLSPLRARHISENLTSLFREMTMEMKNGLPYHQLFLGNLGNLTVLQILRLCAPQNTKFISKDCRKVVDYIDSHYNQEINLDVLAKQIFFSTHYLSHMFKAEMGVSPIKYLTDKRISEAKKLLENTNFSVTKIAETVGYTDSIYFSQFFKKKTGVSPNEYRTNTHRQ